MIILAGDIGGTKANLALYDLNNTRIDCITKTQYYCKDFSCFEDMITTFIENFCDNQIDGLCLGVAGPVINNICKTTNLPWLIDGTKLQNHLKIQNVYLLNDLEATSYGMLYLDQDSFVELNTNAIQQNGNRAVIAAGTGLGEGILFFDGNKFHPIGSEGGHSDFASQNNLQDQLLSWLRAKYPEHVSVERVVSGMGISNIYDFLAQTQNFVEPKPMAIADHATDKNSLITKSALENDPLCVATLDLFCELYGAEAGNLALKTFAIGGVYVGGGIAPKILPFLQNGKFLDSFLAKGRFKDMLEQVSIKVSLEQETALLGALYFAKDKLKCNTNCV